MRKGLIGIGMLVLLTVVPSALGNGEPLGPSLASCPARVYRGEVIALERDVRPFTVTVNSREGFVYNPDKDAEGYFEFLDRRANPHYPNVRSKDLWVYSVIGQAHGCYIFEENGEWTPVT